TFEPPNSDCKVLLPGSPVTKSQFNSGLEFKVYLVELKRPDCAFMVNCTSIPDNPLQHGLTMQQRFDGAREGMLRSTPGSRLVKEKSIAIKGHPGREFIVEIPNERIVMVCHIYVVHKRLYLLVAGGRGWGADHPDVQKFLQSFELSPAVAAVDPAKEPDP